MEYDACSELAAPEAGISEIDKLTGSTSRRPNILSVSSAMTQGMLPCTPCSRSTAREQGWSAFASVWRS